MYLWLEGVGVHRLSKGRPHHGVVNDAVDAWTATVHGPQRAGLITVAAGRNTLARPYLFTDSPRIGIAEGSLTTNVTPRADNLYSLSAELGHAARH